jgi:hypothetical protein
MVTSANSLLESKLLKNPHHAREWNISIGVPPKDLIEELFSTRHSEVILPQPLRGSLVLHRLSRSGC